MRFLADKDIPFVEEAFSTIGEVDLLPGSKITSDDLRRVDGLIVRTTTKITGALLKGSPLTFIGSATIGTDHVDLGLLRERKIQFASAPGCNANAVGDFVINALLQFSIKNDYDLSDKVVGIVGCGNTGTAVRRRVEALGMTCLLNDPPLRLKSDLSSHIDLNALVEQSDIVSLHVPFKISGKFPTYRLIDQSILQQLRSHTVLVSTCRGGVIDETALLNERDRFKGLLLDVWENEPEINPQVLDVTDIATPHIAGYSFEGKVNATSAIYRKACQFYGMDPIWNHQKVKGMEPVTLSLRSRKPSVAEIVAAVYDIWRDDQSLRRSVKSVDASRIFSSLRNTYRFRREFSSVHLTETSALSANTRSQLRNLGFQMEILKP